MSRAERVRVMPRFAMVAANVALMTFTVHSAARLPGYVRWRRQVVIPASLLSTIGTATTFRGPRPSLTPLPVDGGHRQGHGEHAMAVDPAACSAKLFLLAAKH